MADPIRPLSPDLERKRAEARAAGYTDAEIDAFLSPRAAAPAQPPANAAPSSAPAGLRRPAPAAFPRESTTAVQSAPTPGVLYANDPRSMAREIAQGATFGFGDELEAGLRAPFSDRKYSEIRDDIRGQNAAYAQQHPIAAPLLQVAGGLLSGGAVGRGATAALAGNTGRAANVARAVLAPVEVADNAAWGGRAVNSGLTAAKASAAAGFGATDGPLDQRIVGAGKAAVAGGLTGGLFSAAASGLTSLGRGTKAAAQSIATANPTGGRSPIQRALGALVGDGPASDEDGARRVFRLIQQNHLSLDDLDKANIEADGPDVFGELLGKAGIRRMGTEHRYGQAPQVEDVLTERARGESGRLRAVLQQHGGGPIDDTQFAADKLAEAQKKAGPLYDQALEGRTVTDPRILDLLGRPSPAAAYGRAQRMAADAGEDLPTAQQWRERAKPGADPVPVDPTPPAPPAAVEEAPAPPVVKVKPKDRGPFPSDEELAYMTPADLKKGARPHLPVGDLTNAQLAHELHYARHQDNTDAVVSEIRRHPDWPEQDMYRSVGRNEEADGVIIDKMGFNDRSDFHKLNFQAAAAAKRMDARAPRLQALEAEMNQRTGGTVGDLSPENRGEAWEPPPAGGDTHKVYRAQVSHRPLRDGANYFTPSERDAHAYAAHYEGIDRAATVAPHSVTIRKPARDADILRVAAENGIDVLNDTVPAANLNDQPELLAALKRAGFDGAIGTDGNPLNGRNITSVVPFSKGQVANGHGPGGINSEKPAGDPIKDAASERMMRDKGGEVPSMTAKQVQWWKLALDDHIAELENKAGGTSTTRYRQLVGLRNEVESLLHEHTPGYSEAAAAYAKPMQERDAFRSGVLEGRTLQPADVPRLLSGDKSSFTARGVQNTLLDDLNQVPDGATGRIGNPAPLVMGGPKSRARLEVAMEGDDGKIRDVERVAGAIDRRMMTRQRVLGGPLTAERFADDTKDMAGQALHMLKGKPTSTVLKFLADKVDAIGQSVRGRELDAEARLMLKSGTEDRAAVLALVRKVQAEAQRQGQAQAGRTGTAGAALTRATFGNDPGAGGPP